MILITKQVDSECGTELSSEESGIEICEPSGKSSYYIYTAQTQVQKYNILKIN